MKKQVWIIFGIAVVLLTMLTLIYRGQDRESIDIKESDFGNMQIKSVFEQGANIPIRYTCDGEDINPTLEISDIPENAKSLVLIVDDPDAPGKTWVHWVLWNIDAGTTKIEENSVPSGAIQGVNDFGKTSYGGPCPPSGTHRYFFKLYALDTTLNLDSSAGKAEVVEAMEGHVVAQGELMGRYSRG